MQELDFQANRDDFDVTLYQVSDGTARRRTRTAKGSEYAVAFTPDGKQLLVVLESEQLQIRKLRVVDLLTRAGRP